MKGWPSPLRHSSSPSTLTLNSCPILCRPCWKPPPACPAQASSPPHNTPPIPPPPPAQPAPGPARPGAPGRQLASAFPDPTLLREAWRLLLFGDNLLARLRLGPWQPYTGPPRPVAWPMGARSEEHT